MKTVEISLLHRPSLPTVHVSSVKLAQSEQENLSRKNKKKKIQHRRKKKLIRAESDKKNKQTNNSSHKVNTKTKKDASYKYLIRMRKKTYKILSICEELN